MTITAKIFIDAENKICYYANEQMKKNAVYVINIHQEDCCGNQER